MGSKHSPPKWWLQGALEEQMAEDEAAQRRLRDEQDEQWARDVLGKSFDLKVERRCIPPSTKTIDEFSMGCRVASSPCGICGTKTCMHAYQQHPQPPTEQEKIEQDAVLLGVGFGMLQDDGTVKHLPAAKVLVYHRDHIQVDVRLIMPIETIKLKLEV